MLKINKLSKSFENFKVLDNTDIEINEASIFGLVGENGAGKTTLLRCVAGIYQCESGQVLFNGHDTYQNKDIRKEIFLVNDELYFPKAANISTLCQFYDSFYQLDKAELTKVLNLFKLDVKKPINAFSKGMKRQVALAIALAIKPKLLLLDEAFDGLDPLVRYNLKQALNTFVLENKATIIISSHNLKELEDICDSFGILENGQIKTYGDLLESKANINKYQLAYKKAIPEVAFEDFDILFKKIEGSIVTLVIKGDKETTLKKLEATKPLLIDALPVNFEELFIYEKGVA